MHIIQEIERVFADARVTGSLHARRVDREEIEFSYRADAPVVLASVFKIAVALAFARGVVAGAIDPQKRILVDSRYRSGGIGVGGCLDDVEMSLRDLAWLMMTVSDNAATDVVLEEIGLEAVHAVIRDLDLRHTVITGGCTVLFDTMFEDLGLSPDQGLVALAAARDETFLRATDPLRSSHRSTARDVTQLLSSIWSDDGSTPPAGELVRTMMRDQVWTQRLLSGFPDDVEVAGKTGTLHEIRNEAGVVTFSDGSQYAVGVFLRTLDQGDRQSQADAAIGQAAGLAVCHLRNVGEPELSRLGTLSADGARS